MAPFLPSTAIPFREAVLFRAQGLGFRAWGLGFRVSHWPPHSRPARDAEAASASSGRSRMRRKEGGLHRDSM